MRGGVAGGPVIGTLEIGFFWIHEYVPNDEIWAERPNDYNTTENRQNKQI